MGAGRSGVLTRGRCWAAAGAGEWLGRGPACGADEGSVLSSSPRGRAGVGADGLEQGEGLGERTSAGWVGSGKGESRADGSLGVHRVGVGEAVLRVGVGRRRVGVAEGDLRTASGGAWKWLRVNPGSTTYRFLGFYEMAGNGAAGITYRDSEKHVIGARNDNVERCRNGVTIRSRLSGVGRFRSNQTVGYGAIICIAADRFGRNWRILFQ